MSAHTGCAAAAAASQTAAATSASAAAASATAAAASATAAAAITQSGTYAARPVSPAAWMIYYSTDRDSAELWVPAANRWFLLG